ncbi:HeH/LEM domain-containing protein [Enterococcus mundtii]|nr:HeH/LEM domain-containing protein [Enterococcus mundtii]
MTPEKPGKSDENEYGSGSEGRSLVIDDMKVDELKAELDRLGIEYPSTVKKSELIELLKESE